MTVETTAGAGDPTKVSANLPDTDTVLLEDDASGSENNDTQPAEESPWKADLEGVVETDRAGATDEDVAWARRNGWVPRDKWRGDPLDWVDAKQFSGRGRGINAILEERNRQMAKEIAELRKSVHTVHTENNDAAIRDAEAQLTGIRLRKKSARDDSDFDEYDRASADEAQMSQRLDKLKQAPARQDQGPSPEDKSAAGQWESRNAEWFGVDTRRTNLYRSICAELRIRRGDLVGKVSSFLAEADRIAAQDYPDMFGEGTKVQSRTSGGGNMPTRPAKPAAKGWAELPKEAQETADRLIRRNPKLTRADYAKEYWLENDR